MVDWVNLPFAATLPLFKDRTLVEKSRSVFVCAGLVWLVLIRVSGCLCGGLFDVGIANDKSRVCSTSRQRSSSWLTAGFTLEDFSLFT